MMALAIIRDYLVWHYSVAYIDYFSVWRNFLWAVNHAFSVPEVILHLFSPFKRLQEKKVNVLANPQEFFANLFVNIMMRIVGTMIRAALLSISAIAFTAVLLLGFAGIFFWTLAPVIVVHLMTQGLLLIIGL